MGGEAGVRTFDHVALAVRSLRDACRLFAGLLGGRVVAGGDDEDLGLRSVQLVLPPGVKVELLQPLRADCYLQAYLDRHGEGVHHLTCYVDDVAVAVAAAEAAGFETVDTDLSRPHWRETFVRPRSAFGTLIQLAAPDPGPTLVEGMTLEDILEGRVVWHRGTSAWRHELTGPPEGTRVPPRHQRALAAGNAGSGP